MNLYQCQSAAKKTGFDNAKFICLFPSGPIECQWLDAYMGLFTIKKEGLDDGFVTINMIDELFPDLYCSEPWIPEGEEE